MSQHGTPAGPEDRVRPLGVSTVCRAVAGTLTGTVRPRRPAQTELAAIRDTTAPLPESGATVRLRALPQVARTVPAGMVAEGTHGRRGVRIGLRTFVVEHPQARMLLDPSVGTQVRGQVLSAMPAVLRAAVTPPADILSTVEALHRAGINPADLDLALPTHLHWDHVSGLIDLPKLPVLVHRQEWTWAMSSDLAPVAGVRPALRDRPVDLLDLAGPPVLTFPRSHDVFGDGAVLLVDLAGHTPGSVGVLLHEERGWVLLAGDAVWHHLQMTHTAQKASFPGLLVDEDRDATYRTLLRLAMVPEHVRVLPSHDHDMAATWQHSENGGV